MTDMPAFRAQMFERVTARGYDVLPAIPGLDAETAARDPWDVAAQVLGEPPVMVERQPIKPMPQGKSFASNTAYTPLHTDSQMFRGVSPHVQLMFCGKAAREGGVTLLLDTHRLLEAIRQEEPRLFRSYFTEVRKIPFVFGDVVGPTVSWRANCLVFTHSPMRLDDPLALKLETWMVRVPIVQVPVQDGEVLAVDNHRMLHGRTAFFDETRRFTRLLVWRRTSLARHDDYEALARANAHLVAGQVRANLSETTELRRTIVLEILRGVPPGILAQRYGVREPLLYVWRDAAIAGMDAGLERME